jgi:uncharacterized protein (TIGR03083 family)
VTVDYERHVAALRHEGAALSAAARRGVDAAVPSCPEWVVADVVDHVVRIYERVARLVRQHSDAALPDSTEPRPAADALPGWLDEAHAELLDALATEDPESRCWNWSGNDLTVRWWARRMAHETAVHRWDAQLAHGAEERIEAELAADGVAELLDVFLPSGLSGRPVDGLAGTFAVTVTDTGDAWHGRLWPDRADVAPGPAPEPPDAELRGSANDLLLAMWGRDVRIEATGDERITRLLLE